MYKSQSVLFYVPKVLVVVLLAMACGLGILHPRPVTAQQITPFLTTPYYGNTTTISQWFSVNHGGIDFLLRYTRVLAAGALSRLSNLPRLARVCVGRTVLGTLQIWGATVAKTDGKRRLPPIL